MRIFKPKFGVPSHFRLRKLAFVKSCVGALAVSFKTRLSGFIFKFNDPTRRGSWEG